MSLCLHEEAARFGILNRRHGLESGSTLGLSFRELERPISHNCLVRESVLDLGVWLRLSDAVSDLNC